MARWGPIRNHNKRAYSRIAELLDQIYRHEPWMARGTCIEVGGDGWYNPHASGPAKRICRTRCDVAAQCLDYSLRTQQEYGIWGGVGPAERARALGLKKMPAAQEDDGAATPRDEDPMDTPEPICICTAEEVEQGTHPPECPRHRPKNYGWVDDKDWS